MFGKIAGIAVAAGRNQQLELFRQFSYRLLAIERIFKKVSYVDIDRA
ncbi:MAG: hypothetical protein HC778_02735 [Chamaesiphon sp. CSU_1_12]|nr:hypothetical protein [Chamaesiphon sp. CSU_1_12]